MYFAVTRPASDVMPIDTSEEKDNGKVSVTNLDHFKRYCTGPVEA